MGKKSLFVVIMTIALIMLSSVALAGEVKQDVAIEAEKLLQEGLSRRAQKDYAGAIECYEKAINIQSDYSEAYYQMGCIYGVLRKPLKAIECYEKAINYDDGSNYSNTTISDISFFNMGNEYNGLGKYSKALECYEKSRLDSWIKYYSMGGLYYKIDNINKAIECFEKTTQLAPKFADAYYNLFILYKRIGDSITAEEYYNKAISLNPELKNLKR